MFFIWLAYGVLVRQCNANQDISPSAGTVKTESTRIYSNAHQQIFALSNIAYLLLGGVLLVLFADLAFVRLRAILYTVINAIRAVFDWGTTHFSETPLTRTQVMQVFSKETWQREAYDDFKKVLSNEDLVFPCIYATKGFKTDDQLYLFIDSDDLSDPRHIRSLATALEAYLPKARDLGPNTSLVLLAKKTSHQRTIEEYNRLFWELLNGLARLDTKPWPVDVPRDIDTDKWCFCFGGEPFFTVVQTPAHQHRRSRYAPGLTIVFQPKWIFDVLFSTDARRAGALSKVRALLSKYDPIPVSPELKNYGDPGSRESTQYFLLDENEPASCPYEKLGTFEILNA